MKSLGRVQLFVTPWTACSLPGSSVHGIFQARVLEWGATAFSGRTDVEAETPIHWPPDVKSQLSGKDPDAGKN